MAAIGKRYWAIAGDDIRMGSDRSASGLTRHEAACLLNCSDLPAKAELVVYFTDQEPADPYRVTVPARHAVHLRLDDLTDRKPLPRNMFCGCVIRSNQPIVVQHTRLDSGQVRDALTATMPRQQD